MGIQRICNLALAAAAAGMAFGAVAAAQPAGAPASGGDHLLKLTNAAKSSVSAVYVAPAGSRDMSDDLLGKQTAGVGKTVTLKVKDPKGTCVFDLQFLMNDGDTVNRKGVDLCQSSALTLTP